MCEGSSGLMTRSFLPQKCYILPSLHRMEGNRGLKWQQNCIIGRNMKCLSCFRNNLCELRGKGSSRFDLAECSCCSKCALSAPQASKNLSIEHLKPGHLAMMSVRRIGPFDAAQYIPGYIRWCFQAKVRRAPETRRLKNEAHLIERLRIICSINRLLLAEKLSVGGVAYHSAKRAAVERQRQTCGGMAMECSVHQ